MICQDLRDDFQKRTRASGMDGPSQTRVISSSAIRCVNLVAAAFIAGGPTSARMGGGRLFNRPPPGYGHMACGYFARSLNRLGNCKANGSRSSITTRVAFHRSR
jgi:hypothetical protein